MTTIAFKDGTLAADTLCTAEGQRYKHGRKIGCGKDFVGYFVVGCVGDASLCQRFLEWSTGKLIFERPSMKVGDAIASAYVFRPVPKIEGRWTVTEYENDLPGLDFEVPIKGFAAGSGRSFALGAMHAGSGTIKAVEAALAFDVYSGGPIEYVIMPTDDTPKPCVIPVHPTVGSILAPPPKSSTKRR